MSEFFFYKKGNNIIAIESIYIESTYTERVTLLVKEGWEKLHEEVQTSDAGSTLSRLADIRKEEDLTEHAFITGSVFSGLLSAILK